MQKEYAEKMPYLAKVWDGSRGRVGDNLGYTLCMAIACENGCRKVEPLMLRLWSSVHPECVSESDEVEQGYLTRWRVEDTIRFIKQSYRLRLLDYQRLKNMAALVVAVAYFAAAWLGKNVKLDALAKHVAKVSRKMFEVPEFFYYAIADGLMWLFVRHGRWRGWKCPKVFTCSIRGSMDVMPLRMQSTRG